MKKIGLCMMSLLLVLCADVLAQDTYPSQPALDTRVAEILHLDGLRFIALDDSE